MNYRARNFEVVAIQALFMNRIVILFLIMVAAVGQKALAQTGAPVASPGDTSMFERQVAPLLQDRCLGCHGVGVRLSGLDLRTRDSALKGGIKGPSIVPGHAAASLLYKMVIGEVRPQMPPNQRLAPAEVAILKRWLDSGAPWTRGGMETARKQTWWSFKAPVRPVLPAVEQAGGSAAASRVRGSQAKKAAGSPVVVRPPANPIDRFIVARLREQGLSMSRQADRKTLIRRASLDLIGLPPTPDEVRAFENDRSANAWEKVVDRLLASPRYGERWGRHWLDVVRYADSGGFEGDRDRAYAWRYRDYVIDAFNRDLPYDRFLREQIAGDEISPNDNRTLIATGYLAVGPKEIVMENDRNRADQLDDLVSTTGQAMLGLTLNCARCHDHKYDPITTRDYYRLSACFAPSQRREVEVLTADERKPAKELSDQLALARNRLDTIRARGKAAAAKNGIKDADDTQVEKNLEGQDKADFRAALAEVKTLQDKWNGLPRAEIVTDAAALWPETHILVRGDAGHPGPAVQPGFIASLPGGDVDLQPNKSFERTTGRRTALADWIANRNNPLTARVWMNRVWRHHFGRGIVNTPSNFGLSGELPSHPELLDWLACEFMDKGWRLKPIHKLILMSDAWQQDDRIRSDAASVDPDNRLLWRVSPRRLEAEAIRDSILFDSGSLNLQMGGPPVYPPIDPSLRADTFQGPNWKDGEDGQSTWRRSVYVKVKRSLLLPELEVFDCPEITTTVAARNVTTTPTQALTLLNDPLILKQAQLFAQRVAHIAGPDPSRQVNEAYSIAFGRRPSSRELALSLDYLRSRSASGRTNPLADLCHALFNANEFVYMP